jgi:hypothetical protein
MENTPEKVVKAYVLYWDITLTVISECTIYAETVYPLTLPQAIIGFRPEFAIGANVNFEFVGGEVSVTNIFNF